MKTEIIETNNELLNIFETKEDKTGTDLLKMSNYLDILVSKTTLEIEKETNWKKVAKSSNLLGVITTAIKNGYDISESKMLVADTSHFSQNIVEGLKSGFYHIGQSKEVAGHLRPAVLDKNEHLVKFVTLKKAINPSKMLTDISNLSMQLSLKQISDQIEEISKNVQYLIEFQRRESLSVKFLNSRDRIQLALTEKNRIEQEHYLKEADIFLMEGLNALYADVNAEVDNLAKLSGPFISLKTIDSILGHINEDMQMIPRYVGMRAYLFNIRNKKTDADRILYEYRENINIWNTDKIGTQKYTALELIHQYYPYSVTNMDFWINWPLKILDTLKSTDDFLINKPKEVIYISTEEQKHG